LWSDLHQIIYFRAFANDRRAERAAVNRHVRSDFHVVADDDAADLRHFTVSAGVKHIAETVRTDHRAGVYSHALAKFRARIKRDVGEQHDLLAQSAIRSDEIAAMQGDARSDPRSFADNAVRSDVRGGINLSGRRHNRRRVDPCRQPRFGEEDSQCFGEGYARVGNSNQDFGSRDRLAVNNDGRSSTLLSTHEVTFVFSERQIAGLSAVGGGETIEDGSGVAHDLALQVARNFSGGKRHIDEIADPNDGRPIAKPDCPIKLHFSRKRRAARSI
jgi:hypothetical protein